MTRKQLPPDPEDKNDDRAEWAAAALREFQRRTGTDDEDALSDLLCDLMHWSDRNNFDFDTELSRARMHYEAETTPEHGDLLDAAERVSHWETGDRAAAVRDLAIAVATAKGGAQ
jgi:hypothetical protein